MSGALRSVNRLTVAAAIVTGVCGAAAAALQGACVTAPPPALPVQDLRPTILHDSVVPPADVPLTQWPAGGQFIVPVQLDDPDEPFCWVVFVDYNPYVSPSGLVAPKKCESAPPSALDGGVVLVSFTLEPGDIDLATCHSIEFLVAQDFESDSHTPTSPGGDSVTWSYVPGGGAACITYDAGAFEDGPYLDAPADGLPVTPPDSAGSP